MLIFSFFAGCITTDQLGREIQNLETGETPPTIWELDQIVVRPSWTKDDLSIPVLFAGLPENSPEYFSIPDLPPPGDQGNQASGSAWAAGYVALSVLVNHERGEKTYRCSPAFIYNSLNSGADHGVELKDVLDLLKNTGCPRQELMPYRPENYSERPDNNAYSQAASYRIRGFGRVEFTDVKQIKAHLLQRSVVLATLRITEDFVSLKGPIWEKPSGEVIGRHTVAVVGYDNRKELFLVQNSAGSSWGQYGYASIPYAWFVRMAAQAYIMW